MKLDSAPSVQVLTGAQGIKAVYESILTGKAGDFMCTSKAFDQILGGFWKSYAPKLYKNLKTREILVDNQENRDYAKKKNASKNQVRFCDPKLATETDFIVAQHMVALVSYSETSPMAVVISEPELVTALKNQFDQLWVLVSR
jgi:hypothetical protein